MEKEPAPGKRMIAKDILKKSRSVVGEKRERG